MPDRGAPAGREAARRLTTALVFLFYGLLLAEGPLRKWVLPGASNALVFVRDPVMVLILLAYGRMGVSATARRVLAVWVGAAGLILACASLQLATSAVAPLALLAGLRNYLLFVPLCCVIPDAFSSRDYAHWVRLNLLLAPAVGALVVAQYRAGPEAWINTVPGGGSDGVFLLVEDVVRPYGLFSFTLGHSAYAAWMLAVLLAATVGRRDLAMGLPLLVCGTAGVAAMGLFSGSRTYLLFTACVIATFVAVALLAGRPAHKRLAAVIVAGLGLAVGATLVAVPSVAAALVDRQAAASASEGATSDRVAHVVTDFVDELGHAPAFGLGLGAGTNIANYLSSGRTDHVLAEYELTRIVQELGPFFGLSVILLRWSLAAWFAALAAAAARAGNLQPACSLGLLLPVFMAHDITLQNSMIGIAWFAAGIFLTALRLGAPSVVPPVRIIPAPLRREGVPCA